MKQNKSQYADDTNVFLDGEVSSLRALLTLFHKFEKLSGLKLMKQKRKYLALVIYIQNKNISKQYSHIWTGYQKKCTY